MISYKKAISLIKKNSIILPSKKISIEKALYKVCAKDILSPSKYPTFNNSAFDGFALSSNETKGLNSKKTKKFKILKTIAAGDNPKINKYKKNSSVEIMTGALIPKKFDTILPVEKTKYFPSIKKPTHIIVDKELKKFEYVRFAGEEYKSKSLVIKKGFSSSLEVIIAYELMKRFKKETILTKKNSMPKNLHKFFWLFYIHIYFKVE